MALENRKISDAYSKIGASKEPTELSEASLAHVIGKKHDGYFIISACRDDWKDYELAKIGGENGEKFNSLTPDEKAKYLDNRYWNNLNTQKLCLDLRRLGYGFVPVYGGFSEKSDENPYGKTVLEKSLFVPYQLKNPNILDGFEKMKGDIIALGKKYRQESVAICPPDEAPYYYVTTKYGNGDDVGTEQRYFGKDYKINDLAKHFFTSLNKVDSTDRGFDKANPKRFSFESTCESVTVNIPPYDYFGAYGRFVSGEIFNSRYPSNKMAVI